MDFMCGSGLLGNSSTASGSSNRRGTVGPSYSYAVGTSCFAVLLSIFAFIFSPSSSCFYVLFHSYCSHVQVYGKHSFKHEFRISCSHTEWTLLSLVSKNSDKIWNQSDFNQNSKLTQHLISSKTLWVGWLLLC